MSLIIVEQKIFRDEEVHVDGQQFKNCRFERATLVYAGGDLPSFVNCHFVQVSLDFTDTAANTLSFLGGLHKGGFAPAVDKIIKGVRTKAY